MVAVTIELPSPAQLRKLMSGRPVRIKHLPASSSKKGMEVDLAAGVLKKLMRSFSKGSGMIHSMPVHTMPYPARPLKGRGREFPCLVKNTTGEGFFDSLMKGEPYVLKNGVAPMSVKAISEGRPFGYYMDGRGVKSGKISRSKKFGIWTKNLGGLYTGIAEAVKPVAKPILEALTQAAVSKITPQASYEKAAIAKMDPAKNIVSVFRGLFGLGVASPASRLQFEKLLRSAFAKRRRVKAAPSAAPSASVEEARVAFEEMAPDYAVPERMESTFVEEGGVPLDYKYFGAGAKKPKKTKADKAIEKRITESLGGRPVKGSQAMKDKMSALRARKKGGAMYPAGY